MSESLKHKTAKGTAWSFADNIANQGITFLVGLVLARILTPVEYGLIGIIMIFIALFNAIIDSGFSTALIRKNDATHTDYNTVFLVNMGASVVLFFVLYFGARWVGVFFNQPDVELPLKVMGSILIINAIALIQNTIIIKNIDFKTLTKISLIASISSGVIGIAIALMGGGVWALVAQQISRQGIRAVLMWVYNKWRPNLAFSKQSFKELFGFGWKIMVSGLLDTLWKDIYKIVIGKFYTATTLGYYSRAQQFGQIFSTNITRVVQNVTYPVLSSIQDDVLRLKMAYKKVIKTTMLMSFTCMLGLAAVAKPMIVTLIGAKWLGAVPILQIICFTMMLYPLHAINLNMLKVKGRSDIFLYLEIVKKAISVGPVLIGIFWNIYLMLAGSAVVGVISYFLNAYYSGRTIGYTVGEQLRDIAPDFLVALSTALVMFALSFLPLSMYTVFAIQILAGLLFLFAVLHLTKLPEYLEIKEMVVKMIKRKS